MAKEQLIFCGDTAQTIAKGVNFRFSDLTTLFYQCKMMGKKQLQSQILQKQLKFKYLTVNIKINDFL